MDKEAEFSLQRVKALVRRRTSTTRNRCVQTERLTYMLKALLGINWKTTLAGVTAIIAAFGRIAVAWRTRDFSAIFTDGQLIVETIGMIVLGLGLLKAKDQNVTGAGTAAKTIHSDGTVEHA